MQLLLGDEAVGQAALDAGIRCAEGYPGTPSTEIFEYIEAKAGPNVHAHWSANEAVALEQALGASFVGQRAIVTMKHVGLNVAADAFMNAAVTGVHGGVVLAVADDPGMHSSQNEQDSRYYAAFAKLPCLEPSNAQEAYDFTREAFELSEKVGLPVVLRLVTRLSHSRAGVETREPVAQPELSLPSDLYKPLFSLLPGNARIGYAELLKKQIRLLALNELAARNDLELQDGEAGKIGVIASGIAYNYVREIFPTGGPSVLKISRYPLPLEQIRQLAAHCDQLCVIEEGYPFIEEQLQDLLQVRPRIRGRKSAHLPQQGELTPDIVKSFFSALKLVDPPATLPPVSQHLRARPPQLCPGCPHADTYKMLAAVRQNYELAPVFGDIGCYTLGFYPPYEGLDSVLCMGASISMAKGAADAGMKPVLAVIGDSTFGHSGLGGLLTAAHENTPMTVLILDNSTTAMTGAQESLAHGDPLQMMIEGLGVNPEHIKVVVPLPKNHAENVEILRKEVDYQGLSVVISRRACVQLKPQKPAKPEGGAK